MIYVVTRNRELFEEHNDKYIIITPEQSRSMLEDCNKLQYDSETTGLCPEGNIDTLICYQFGSQTKDFQLVIDASSVSPIYYKDIFESKLLIGHNISFDLKFLLNYNIVPTKVYDTMIVEQLLYLGDVLKGYDLARVVNNYIPDVYLDKSVRANIADRGVTDTSVIIYSALDVAYLETVMHKQVLECKKKECLKGAKLECDFVPVLAYMEWCGIHLDVDKWTAKMKQDKENYVKAKKALDDWLCTQEFAKHIDITIVTNKSKRVKAPMVYIDNQGDLFNGYNTEYQSNVNWDSTKHVIPIVKELGFDTSTKDKKTGENKDTLLEKHLSNQKGINDEFLKLFFNYKQYSTLISTFGQGHLNQVNPITGNIHTNYRQLGTTSGRMSCGSTKSNTSLAKYKKIDPKECTYANIQQLPSDEATRACFTAKEGNLIVSCDWSALESRLGADIYNEPAMIDEYLYGSGDMHSLMAKVFFEEQIGKDTPTSEIKKKYPHLRKQAKSPEFNIGLLI